MVLCFRCVFRIFTFSAAGDDEGEEIAFGDFAREIMLSISGTPSNLGVFSIFKALIASSRVSWSHICPHSASNTRSVFFISNVDSKSLTKLKDNFPVSSSAYAATLFAFGSISLDRMDITLLRRLAPSSLRNHSLP